MAIFYHVSTNLRHPGIFEPRIPENRHKQAEDELSPRVCVCPTIEDCLSSIPNGGGLLENLYIYLRSYFLVFRIDTEKLKIAPSSIISSKELFEKDLVRDAEMTDEHWITVPFTVPDEDKFIIQLLNYEEEPYDIVPYSIYKIADEKFEGNYITAYEKTYNEFTPCSVKIKHIKFITENVLKGNEITIFFETDYEKTFLSNYIKKHLPAKITEVNTCEIKFITEKDVNLRDLFISHFKFVQML